MSVASVRLQAQHTEILQASPCARRVIVLVFVGAALPSTAGGHDLSTSNSAVAATPGNVGPGLARVGPTGHRAAFCPFDGLLATALMLLGRFESFTALARRHPTTYRD